jgi:hypothetical protein
MIDHEGRQHPVLRRNGVFSAGPALETRFQLFDSSLQSDFSVLLTGFAEGTSMPKVEVCVHLSDGREVPMTLDVRQIDDSKNALLVRLRDLRESSRAEVSRSLRKHRRRCVYW